MGDRAWYYEPEDVRVLSSLVHSFRQIFSHVVGVVALYQIYSYFVRYYIFLTVDCCFVALGTGIGIIMDRKEGWYVS